MDALLWEAQPPPLRSPMMVCAFAGWNDAAGSATTALTTAAESLDAEVFAQVDPEDTVKALVPDGARLTGDRSGWRVPHPGW